MLPVRRFPWESTEYAQAFATLLRCADGRGAVRQLLRELFAAYPATSRAVDWGAGGGDLTSVLLEHFHCVYAVEPHPSMRTVLATRCPAAQLVDGTLMTAVLPTPVEVGLLSHVLYHIPDQQWGASILHAAHHLTDDGMLLVTLKDRETGCNQMLEHFGAPRYDLYGHVAGALQRQADFTCSFRRIPVSLTTTSFAETLTIARFMLCDRAADAFVRSPTEAEFQAYVREHFWDEATGTGGWNCTEVICCVQRKRA